LLRDWMNSDHKSWCEKEAYRGECTGLQIYSQNNCIDGKDSIKVFVRAIGYETYKRIS